jgi:hypothetical protein
MIEWLMNILHSMPGVYLKKLNIYYVNLQIGESLVTAVEIWIFRKIIKTPGMKETKPRHPVNKELFPFFKYKGFHRKYPSLFFLNLHEVRSS